MGTRSLPPPPRCTLPPPTHTHTLPVRWVWVPPSFVLWGGGARAFLPCFLLLILHLQPLLGLGAEWELVVHPLPSQQLQPLWGALGAAPQIHTALGVKLFHVSLCVFVSSPRVGSVLGFGGGWVGVCAPHLGPCSPPLLGANKASLWDL